jgi:hypothetical protein
MFQKKPILRQRLAVSHLRLMKYAGKRKLELV